MPAQHLRFGPFSLEAEPPQLKRGTEQVALRPKSLAVLRYLAERPGQLISKDELLETLWSGRVVGHGGLRVCVREIRTALGDRAETPQYLETVTGRGYRFMEGRDGRLSTETAGLVVGRESELRRLNDCLQLADGGERQFVLIGGEPGIGKTTLLERFLDPVAGLGATRVARGQCVVQYGKGEAYGPIFEALTRLCRGPDGAEMVAVLQRYAPMWLVQLPGLVDSDQVEQLQLRIGGATSERMTRELCNAIEVLAAENPLVLVLEDLHWADVSTIDLLAALARRPESTRLLLLGTYRPADAVLYARDLRDMVRDLRSRHQCMELLLELLSSRDVASYLRRRLSGEVADSLAAEVFQRSNGNPLFMVNLIDDLVQRQLLVRGKSGWTASEQARSLVQAVPETLRSLISRRFEALSRDERSVLESGSTQGFEFTVAATAAGLGQSPEDIDVLCESLALHGQFIDAVGIEQWPDGTLCGCYRFQHPLYCEVLYDEIGEARRARLHRHIAERIETGYSERIADVAAVLAVQFDKGRVADRGAHYRKVAAEQAIGRYAYPEAIEHLTRGIDLVDQLPEGRERDRITLELLMMLGPALTVTGGYTTPEVEQTYARAQALCERLEDPCYDFPVLWGLTAFHFVRGDFARTSQIAERLRSVADETNDPDMDLMVCDALAQLLLMTGEIEAAHQHAEHVFTRYDIEQHRGLATRYSEEDPGVVCGAFDALILWLLGFPDQSSTRLQSALALAREIGNPHSTGLAMVLACFVLQLRGEPQATLTLADELNRLAAEHGLVHWHGLGTMLHGWALVQQGDTCVDLARLGLANWRATGAGLFVPYCFGVLAETHRSLGEAQAAHESVIEAKRSMERTQERWIEAELYRLEGELLLEQGTGRHGQAQACFERALDVSRGQRTKSLELRAAVSLSRLWQQQGRHGDARQLLEPVCHWFKEGFESTDLRDAETLVDELGRS